MKLGGGDVQKFSSNLHYFSTNCGTVKIYADHSVADHDNDDYDDQYYDVEDDDDDA